VCYWTDSPVVTAGDLDALFVAQRSYRVIGAGSADWLDAVRAPLPGEGLDPAWLPMEGVDDRAPTPRQRASVELERKIELVRFVSLGRTSLREHIGRITMARPTATGMTTTPNGRVYRRRC
jgi:hypothetical protein